MTSVQHRTIVGIVKDKQTKDKAMNEVSTNNKFNNFYLDTYNDEAKTIRKIYFLSRFHPSAAKLEKITAKRAKELCAEGVRFSTVALNRLNEVGE